MRRRWSRRRQQPPRAWNAWVPLARRLGGGASATAGRARVPRGFAVGSWRCGCAGAASAYAEPRRSTLGQPSPSSGVTSDPRCRCGPKPKRVVTDALAGTSGRRSEEHSSELQSRQYLVCRLLLEKKKKNKRIKNIL